MTTKTYSVANDTGSGEIIAGQLFLEIEKNQDITTTVFSVNVSGDVITIVFKGTISSEEETELDSLVNSHLPREYRNFLPIVFQPVIIKSKHYQTALSFFINGTNNEQGIDSVKFVSKKVNGSGNYSIRLYDSTNNKVLFEQSYTNTTYQMFTIDSISNIPDEEAVLEIQAKVSNKPCYIKACKITN